MHDFRRDYLMAGLRRADLEDNPIHQFEGWFKVLLKLGTHDPNAMVLATANGSGEVDQRIVLLKEFGEQGFDFFTNKHSKKSQAMNENPKVSLHFPWHFIERQVKVNGVVQALTEVENDTYFFSRPRESRLAAWASAQSQPIESREILTDQYESLNQQYPNEVPRPPNWGGYRVVPTHFEFWQGGAHRLHDRFVYSRQTGGEWLIERLSP